MTITTQQEQAHHAQAARNVATAAVIFSVAAAMALATTIADFNLGLMFGGLALDLMVLVALVVSVLAWIRLHMLGASARLAMIAVAFNVLAIFGVVLTFMTMS